ncbi:MAG: hypothetical protein GOMPHAMPRED_003428 [Gomphillus americanus]|uniref:Uncharacterized protein n=1 Tax=Gomphillus americanus TaxID=1940652 RepID=A0A8H3IJZ8_9LECA|nr:MAG: hypothetical protein GOMPHAMPRED_003428 [Gomphillus americanus]
MRSSYRTKFTVSIVAALILWYFVIVRRVFPKQQVLLEQTPNNKAAHHHVLYEVPLATQTLAITEALKIQNPPAVGASEVQLPETTQASIVDRPPIHTVSPSQQLQTTVAEYPDPIVKLKDVDRESPDKLSLLEQDKTLSKSGLKRGELVMIVASSGNGGYLGVPGVREMVYENRMSYADRWGHEFMWANMSRYNFSKTAWNKIPIIQDAHIRYPQAKWFWWLDFDAIIVNGSLDIYDHVLSSKAIAQNLLFDKDIPRVGGGSSGFRTPAVMKPEDVNMLISFDNWGMNTGSFLMRRCGWTDMVLEIWADPVAVEKDWIFFDQDGWVHLYQHNEFVRKYTGVVKQRSFNGYAKSNPLGAQWQSGDYVVHFAGCGSVKNMTNCRNNWQSYWEKRDNYTTPGWILEQIKTGTAPIESVQKGKP